MLTQQERLEQFSIHELMRATLKYDELLQMILQNQILVNLGMWDRYLFDSTPAQISEYVQARTALFERGLLNEDKLRKMVIEHVNRK